MRTKHWYLGLAVLGTVLPYSQFLPFLHEHGLNLGLFLQQLFANRVSSFFALDVVVSSVALWVLILVEGRRLRMRYLWVPLLSNLAVGVSLALPLFLYLRERSLNPAGGS
jgi:Terpene cyclase DEP1